MSKTTTSQNVVGKLLDSRYQVVKILGAGGFGQTYIAQDTRRPGSPTCVVKHLKPASSDPKILDIARRLFRNEGETLESLGSHDQIPRLLAYFEESQEFYLVQEFIKGHTLSAELLPNQHWAETQVIRLLQEVLGILEFVHSQGVIHRDIKPDNIIRRQQDNNLVLVDFGAVKQVRTQLVTVQGQPTASVAIGTPGYMPTEQGQGKPRPNSDIYALGIICIQALTGMSPMQLQKLEDPDTGELIWQNLVPVSSGLTSVLTKIVRYHFKDRYQSATETLQALQQMCSGYYTPTEYAPPQPTSNIQPPKPPTQPPPGSKQNSVSTPNNHSKVSATGQASGASSSSHWLLPVGSAIAATAIAVGITWAIIRLPKTDLKPDPVTTVSPSQNSNLTPNQSTTGSPTPELGSTNNSVRSNSSTPGSGSKATPDRSNSSTPGSGSKATPDRSNSSTPGSGSKATPDRSNSSTPGSGSKATPDRNNSSTPGSGSKATPDRNNSSTPGSGKTGSVKPPEVVPPEDTLPEVVPPEDTLPEVVPPEDTPPEDTLPEVVPPEDTPPEDTPPEDTPPEDTPPEDTPPEVDHSI